MNNGKKNVDETKEGLIAIESKEVAMEKQSVWNDFVNLRRLLGNAGKNTNAKQI